MRDFAEYVLKVLHYPCGEISFCGLTVITAADIPELRCNDIAQLTPKIYDMHMFGGLSPADVLWEKLLLLWLFDDSGFNWNDWGVYCEVSNESYIIPHVIRKPMTGFHTPFTWSGADCDPFTLLCLAKYYDYGAVCIRFLRKWRIFVNQLYMQGHVVFESRKLQYNKFITKVTERVTELTQYLVDSVTGHPEFQEYLKRTPTCVYHELRGKSSISAEELDLLFDVLNDFFTAYCRY